MNCFRILVLLIFLASLAVGQQRRRDEPISVELYTIVTGRIETIRKELEGVSQYDWAGMYADGDHHPTIFSWSPRAGFVVTSSLHTFSPSWVNFGRVQIDGNSLSIFPELKPV
jgi:hypothetical protein